MKMNLRQKAKSALSILLTLCMILSVLTVGIVSTSAAETEIADSSAGSTLFTKGQTIFLKTGSSSCYDSSAVVKAWYNYNGNSNDWGVTIPASLKSSCYYTIVPSGGDSNCVYIQRFASNGTTYWNRNGDLTSPGRDSDEVNVIQSNGSGNDVAYWNGTLSFDVQGDLNSSSTTWSKLVDLEDAGDGKFEYEVTDFYPQKASNECKVVDSDNVWYGSNKTVSLDTTKIYSIKYSFDITTQTLTVTPTVTGTQTTPLPTPTWSSSTVAVNAGTAATLTVSNHSTIKGQDSDVTYVLTKGSSTLTSGTDYTFDNSTGVFTLTDTTTAAAGSYTVQAIAYDTTLYNNSAVSTAATVNVYESLYSLSGNDVAGGAFEINGTTPAITTPTGTNTYFNTYQSNYAISTATSTPGVYKLTFKVKDDYDGNPDISIAQSGNTQRAFNLNDEAYNTSTHGDITVTDEGISDSDNLYLYTIGTPAGGSLYLKKGQTYTITIDQTQRYDSGSPYGKIMIETGDIFAETAAKKQTFNATDCNYDAVSDAADTIGTASSSPVHSTKPSMTSTLTATEVNPGYEFIGWYKDDANCEGTPDIAASACTKSGSTYTKSETLTETHTYYALFKQKLPTDYTVTVNQPSYGEITLTGGVASTGTSSTTAYQGATVSLNATVTDNSKEFSHWLITNASTDVDITSTVCASPSLRSSSFTMPGVNVKVTAIYSNKTPVTITTSSNNTSLGNADYTADDYYVGDTITITATPVSGLNGGVFSRWVVTGGTIDNANSATAHVTATGSTVTARAIFDYKTYQLFSDKDISGNTPSAMYTMVRLSDGRYVSTRTVNKSTGSFTIYDVKDTKYARPSTTQDYEMHSGYTSNNINSWSSSSYKYKIKSDDSASYYVIFDPRSGQGSVTITTDNPLGTIAQIYAKDGSIRYYDTNKTSGDLWEAAKGGTTANRGQTVVKQINGTDVPNPDTKRYPSTGQSEHLKVYSAAIGNTITIETTVNDTYKTQGFYVGMFVINGWKVEATDVGKGKYTATFTLTDEYSTNNLDGAKSFEITPVYYNKNFEYVTFYVDADSVPGKWKGTVSACADYNGAENAHFEGTYPGQPLGREGDLYEIKVSKYYYDYSSSTGTWSKHTNHQPSVTITAYNFDLVHHFYYVKATDSIYAAADNNNFQTYDFSDFNYLAKIPDVEAILFRCKYESSKSSWQIYNKADNQANSNATTPVWFFVDDRKSDFNTWQVLTDYYGNPIDALGNRIVKSGSGDSAVYYTADDVSTLLSQFDTNATSKVRIVSYGNRNTNTDTANSRTAAKWATGWAVYSGGQTSGTNYQIAYGNPADFICTTPGTASTANVHYLNGKSATNLIGKITYITYDKERTNQISGVSDTGERIDGQWYYSAMQDFDSTVKVAVTTASTSDNTAISAASTIYTDTNSANNTGWIDSRSGTKATLDGKTTETYSNVTTEAELNCTPGSGYTFVGWYIYDGTNYTKIGDNFADLSTTMTMKKNYTIVAVVREVGAGDLVITHSRYTGSKPEAHDGSGKYFVSAVLNEGKSNERVIAEKQNSITVDGLQATDTLTIKIRTVCNGADTFYAWYEEALGDNYSRTGSYYEICSETEDPIGESEVSYEFFEADCSTFFNGSTLARKTIDLYSDIVHVSAYATLTYKYYDRFAQNGANKMVSYVVKDVPLTDEEIENGYIPSDAKIAQYAPKVVDTIYTDTKWTIAGTKVERAASNVTLMATQTPKTCYVEYLPNAQVGSELLSGDIEADVDDISSWQNATVEYNSWLIDENADMSNPDESDFIVSAPYTYYNETTEKTWTFVRFDVYEYNRLTGEKGDVIYSSNSSTFGYRIYADCVIYPVYTNQETVTKQLTANIEPAVLNREVYGDSASPTDKLYADLLISFINVAAATNGEIPEEIKNLAAESGYSIETGFVLDKNVSLSNTDFNTLKTAAETGSTDTTDTILATYANQFNKTTAENFAKGTPTSGYSKYILDNSKLTNKNRTDGVVRFSNSVTAQQKVYAAYSYIIIKKNDALTAFAISDAQLFNFCYLGNKPLDKVS